MKEGRLRAKEEAEDLAQEMAELRYQMTGLLEEECKRRACVEQISLQRISELEAEVFCYIDISLFWFPFLSHLNYYPPDFHSSCVEA